MKRYDLIVVGAGPSGLSAAIEAAKRGVSVVVFDENAKPGGQLFKQIHKFFGSKEHKAKIRGFKIGEELLEEAAQLGVQVELNTTVIGLYPDKEIVVQMKEEVLHYKGDAIIVATGASENMVTFEGWTLPGVIGAGAAQTLMNLHGVKPGEKVVMLGSGNVGLVVSFQLMQCGCEVVAVVDAAPKIGGYGVHAAKITRCGVPFYLSHTIVKADGEDQVKGVIIGEIDGNFKAIPGTEKYIAADTICMAVGLSPMAQLLKMAGCKMEDNPKKGGAVPIIDQYGQTSIPGLFAVGDVAGIEEASSAMIEGRMAGVCAAEFLGFSEDKQEILCQLEKDLEQLRQGMFAPQNRGKNRANTEEGYPTSDHLLQKGYLADDEIHQYPGIAAMKGIHPVMECVQNIPCNPCQDACSRNCIRIGEKITSLPSINQEATCSGCGLCVAACSGQAIFLVQEDYEEGYATVTLPYEFLPLPVKGEKGLALNRKGEKCCNTEVIEVRSIPAYDHTTLLTMKVPNHMAMTARFYKTDEIGG